MLDCIPEYRYTTGADKATKRRSRSCSPPLRPRATTLRSETFRILRQEILTGALRPGAKLIEAELATRLGVSRNPVREALAKLEDLGLVELVPNQGARVVNPTQAAMQGMLLVHAQLEMLAVRLILRRPPRPELGRLAEIVAQMQAVDRPGATHSAEDMGRLGWLDAQFHEALVACSGEESLCRMWAAGALADLPLVYAVNRPVEGQNLDRSVHRTAKAHARLLAAITSGDPALAENTLKLHFVDSLSAESLGVLGWQ